MVIDSLIVFLSMIFVIRLILALNITTISLFHLPNLSSDDLRLFSPFIALSELFLGAFVLGFDLLLFLNGGSIGLFVFAGPLLPF